MVNMEKAAQELILASEIAGLLHDLGKLYPEFAEENFENGKKHSKAVKKKTGIYAAHGAILEPEREYPESDQLQQHPEWQTVLEKLLEDPFWAEKLKIPSDWCHNSTIQAQGLGAPLRQHHAKNSIKDGFTLLGDLYAFGADTRDSALDKGSGGCQYVKQSRDSAWIIDGLGLPRQPYTTAMLTECWQQAMTVLQQTLAQQNRTVAQIRKDLYEDLKIVFTKALGETRRPTNDVTLYHHGFSTASHFKAAVAEGVLRQDFKHWQDKDGLFDINQMGRVRFRLCGIRWDWHSLTQGALRPVVLASLSEKRREVEQNLRQLFEVDYPVGNIIYRDDHGILVLLPGFYQGDDEDAQKDSENLFCQHIIEPLQQAIEQCLVPLGYGLGFHLYWTAPNLYLTDYDKALGIKPDAQRQRFLQVGVDDLKAAWQNAAQQSGQMQICPQCGLRPAKTRELALDESGLSEQDLCHVCSRWSDEQAFKDRHRQAEALFGFQPKHFNLQKLSQQRGGSENGRMVLISIQVDTAAIASGAALITQLARPVHKLEINQKLDWNANQLGDALNEVLTALREQDASKLKRLEKEQPDFMKKITEWMGDNYWLKEKDGRSLKTDKLAKALDIAENFFLRESVPEGLGLFRHDGDRLALFAQRKHASPARLQRLWDDLEALWRDLFNEISQILNAELMPLSLDTAGMRFIVSAEDASDVLLAIQRRLQDHFSKVRAGLAVHVSALAMRAKFPLYIALDAIHRMEQRVADKPRQEWTVLRCKTVSDKLFQIDWQTPQGEVSWQVNLDCGDPKLKDIWHTHLICVNKAEGPVRLLLLVKQSVKQSVEQLKPGDIVSVPVSTFDFLTLEGSARRFDIHYDQHGRRPHLVLGRPGRAPHLLEQMAEIIDPEQNWAAQTQWNSSQLKGLYGHFVETFERWVRNAVNDVERQSGLMAWQHHIQDTLGRYLPGREREPLRQNLQTAIEDGRFFDAVEWQTYICKHNDLTQTQEENS